MPDQERVKKAIARLYGMKEVRPPKTGYIDGTQALDFNKAIDDLVAGNFDVDEFRIRDSEIVEMAFGPPSVLYDTFITRLNAVLAYLNAKESKIGTVKESTIGFEHPRRS